MAHAAEMIKFDGWVMPAYEEHLMDWMLTSDQKHHGRLCYQAHKYYAAMKYVTEHGMAVDVGGHIGLWSFLMAHDFESVLAFEPMSIHQQCFLRNLKEFGNVAMRIEALGKERGMVKLETRTPNSSGDTGIVKGKGDVPMITLDEENLEHVSFIKIDCEGYEANVIKGAEQTIKRCKPVVVVEQKGKMSEQYGLPQLAAVKLLEEYGMVQKEVISGDYIMAWV